MSGDTAFVRRIKDRLGDKIITLQTDEGEQYISCSSAELAKLEQIARQRGFQVSELFRYGKAIVR